MFKNKRNAAFSHTTNVVLLYEVDSINSVVATVTVAIKNIQIMLWTYEGLKCIELSFAIRKGGGASKVLQELQSVCVCVYIK